jgi:hypothetical protein
MRRCSSATNGSKIISRKEQIAVGVTLYRKRSGKVGSRKKQSNAPQFGLPRELFRTTVVDLTQIDRIDIMTATTILSEQDGT